MNEISLEWSGCSKRNEKYIPEVKLPSEVAKKGSQRDMQHAGLKSAKC